MPVTLIAALVVFALTLAPGPDTRGPLPLPPAPRALIPLPLAPAPRALIPLPLSPSPHTWRGGTTGSVAVRAQAAPIIFATTTSLHDTGLLDSLLPEFERRAGVRVRVVAVGSGQALELGRRGDADVVVAHAPELERPLVDSGYFTSRRLLMHNDFLLVGPAADPAEAAPSGGVVAALGRIAASRARFVSRGDRSGTHLKELELWRRAGVTPPRPGAWYVEAGQAMAQTLLMASEKEAYALSDRSTFLVWRNRLDLVPLVEGDSLLFNVYHVLVTSPRTAGRVNHAGATALAEWLLSPEVQARIGAFGRSRFAQGLFVPAAGKPDRW